MLENNKKKFDHFRPGRAGNAVNESISARPGRKWYTMNPFPPGRAGNDQKAEFWAIGAIFDCYSDVGELSSHFTSLHHHALHANFLLSWARKTQY